MVSVSLRSIIHSYIQFIYLKEWEKKSCFRLLMEYHSFLLFLLFYFNCFILSMGFRLLTEYHSFLLVTEVSQPDGSIKFPSPYGVSFILTYSPSRCRDWLNRDRFRLLMEYHSFLLIPI